MATTKDYRDFVLEQLNLLDNITCKSMMGEYLLYYNGILFGGIYDDRLLVKIVDSNKKYNMQESIPYDGAKPMYLVDDIDNKELLKKIVIETSKGLPIKKQRGLNYMNKEILLSNIDKIHTTEMGINRIKKNLKLDINDVVEYCKNKILEKIVIYLNKERIGIVRLKI